MYFQWTVKSPDEQEPQGEQGDTDLRDRAAAAVNVANVAAQSPESTALERLNQGVQSGLSSAGFGYQLPMTCSVLCLTPTRTKSGTSIVRSESR